MFPNFYKKIIFCFSRFKVLFKKWEKKHWQQGWGKQSPPSKYTKADTGEQRGNWRFAAGNPPVVGMWSQALSPGPAGAQWEYSWLHSTHEASMKLKPQWKPKCPSTYVIKFKCNSTNFMFLVHCYKISYFFWLPGEKLLFTHIVLFEPPKPPLSELCSLVTKKEIGPSAFKTLPTNKWPPLTVRHKSIHS